MRPLALVVLVLTAALAAQGKVYLVAQGQPGAADGNAGTAEAPFKTISAAAKVVQAGDTVLIGTGVYREAVVIEASGSEGQPITFAADPGAEVTVTGADVLTDWRREDGPANVYSTPWPHVFLGWTQRRAHPDDDYHAAIGRVEQVFIGRYPLLGVLARDQMARGTFFVDEPGKRLYVWDRSNADLSKSDALVEASTRMGIWRCTGKWVVTRGIRFRYAASMAQHGAVEITGDHDRLEDCIVEQMNGSGITFGGDGAVARRCVIRDNGQLGFSAGASNLLVTECVIENNNVKNYSRGWEAGGDKLCFCRRAVLDHCIFRRNHGTGVWFDIGNENCEVRNCLIIDNDDSGIFYEISYGLHAHDNVIVGNGLATGFGAWGANGGISLSSSPHCVIERNLLVGNKEGFQFREQGRSTPRIDARDKGVAVWNHDQTVRHNLIAYNRDVQTAGWFDVLDASHWPAAMQAAKLRKAPDAWVEPPPGTDIDRLPERPKGLSLERLKLDLADNLFALKPGARLLQWGCAWRDPAYFERLDEVIRTLGLESGSRVTEAPFADWPSLDLRLPADHPAFAMGCYPQGEVPDVRLGALPR
ncbi:MAG: right-handed parallel beta-helix repeat-containing protein [Armatimonadetes bacterium]|nr:right-handed parallel beta-helix repeat-containing protein [Armatimonadota bacterium]